MAGGASSPSSFTTSVFTYDAFLSFRGEDTRFGFTGHLYSALDHRGIFTFIDDQGIGKGNEITPSLVKAIEESRIAIVVLSKNYASSSFCLDELVNIMECVEKKGRLVIPIFYDVDPSHVRKQTGTFGEALAAHKSNFMASMEDLNGNMERFQRWKMALEEVADLSGYHFKHGYGYEHKFIVKIVEQVSRVINCVALPFVDHPIGLHSQVKKVTSLLDVGFSDEVCILGIHGIGGIGKTTVYNWIACRFEHLPFEGLCFLENIRENSNKHGLQHLQKIILSEIVGEKKIELTSVKQGISMLKKVLPPKQILLILDDVDQHEQLEALAGKSDWFGPGSKVIITTRDINLLSRYEDKITYELETLNEKDALELLSWKALKTNQVDSSYMDILNEVVTYASGLPLALEVIGSNLVGKSIEQWKSAFNQYKSIPIKKIQTILKVNFDALEDFEKEIFLDIACCLKGYALKDVKEILCALVASVEYGLGVLVEKSLLKIHPQIHKLGYWVTVHDLIEEMGKEIVRQESTKRPGERSRLWLLDDIVQVLEENMGTDEIEMIHMDFPVSEKVIKWDGEAFRKMRKIRTLIIRQAHFSQAPKHLPNSLRVLNWQDYPSHSLPPGFHPEELVIFQLHGSNLMSVEFLHKQKFKSLTILNFDRSHIEEIPDVSGVPNLKELSFGHCGNLIKVHESVGFLDELKLSSAEGCHKLRSFPPIKLTNLVSLNIRDCSALENFPEILGKMERIFNLYLCNTSIKELPSSIANLTNLIRLIMSPHSHGTLQLPSSIVMLPCLEDLQLQAYEGFQFPEQDQGEEQGSSMLSPGPRCVNLTNCNMSNECWPIVVAWFRNVVELTLDRNNFTVLPESIQELYSLRFLSLNECKKLREIRGIPPNINEFRARECISLTSSSRIMLLNEELHEDGNKLFYLPGSTIPEWFEHNNIRDSISFWFRNKLPEICLCVTGKTIDRSWNFLICNLFINGHGISSYLHVGYSFASNTKDHIMIFGLKHMRINHHTVANLLLENEWNHVVCSFSWTYNIKQKFGMHVVKHKSSMEDIRFTNPLYEELNEGDFQINLQLTSKLPSLETPQCQQLSMHNPRPINSWDHPLTQDSFKDNVSNSIAQIGISSTTHIRDGGNKTEKSLCALGAGSDDDDLWRYGMELSLRPCWQVPLDCDNWNISLMQSVSASDTIRDEDKGSDDDLRRYGMELSLRPCWQAPLDCDNWNSNLMHLAFANDTIRDEDQDGAVLDHLENCQVESSQAPSHAEMQNIQVSCPTSSSAIVCGEEPHLKTFCTVFPTTTEESSRNQVEQSQEHVETESVLDAGTHVLSHSHDHSSITATSEDFKDALKLIQDFTTNVPFTNPSPLKSTKDNDVGNQLTLLDNGLRGVQQLSLLKSNIPTSLEPVEYTEEDRISLHPSLDDVCCSSYSDSDSDSLPRSLVASPVEEEPVEDTYNNSDSNSIQSSRTIHATNSLPKKYLVLFCCLLLIVVSLFGSTMWHWCFHRNYALPTTEYDQAVLYHPEKAPEESSQVAGFAKMQNTEAQRSTLSSGKISDQELHLNTMLPTTIDESVRGQLEPSDDDAEMEAFYDSLDADNYVLSHANDHSAPSVTSEKAKEALKMLQDFVIKDPSFLLDPKQYSTFKSSLDYLSNLSASDHGFSGEMRALISEASRIFTHSSRDYIEASMKIESTSSELLKADELESDMEDNKNQFKEIVALEKELLQKLFYLEESRKELEKQINAIEASISASQSEQSMTREKKRVIFKEGKTLKTQISEFSVKVPHLQHVQDLARETQAKITAEWSELGEKFKKIVVE